VNPKNANYDNPQAEGEQFDFQAQPSRFFFNIETVGGLEPDTVMQQGIKVLQQKLASVIQELSGQGGDADGFNDRSGSPRQNGINGYVGGDAGYNTPYAGGNASVWGGLGSHTPGYGAAYGQSGQNGW
jgi:DNA-directed RNA polymerase II subunit RPB3